MATESGRIEDKDLKDAGAVDTVQHKKESHGKKSDGNSSFLRAARAGNLEKVLGYLKESIDINTSNANGLNALHLASKEGHVNVVTELLSRGANVDAATKKGNTALHIAALAGQEEIVKILVQSGAKVNAQATTGGFTPLYMAAQENHVEVVKYLLNNAASQTLTTDDGFTPLAVALQQGHDKVVTVLLENDTRGRVRLPALHIAAKKDDVKSASLLLQSDHNVDGQSKSGFTPLHIAAHYGNINVGTLLIDKGADVNFQARNQIQPMHVASKWGKTNMVTLLLDSGAHMESHTRDGLTPLHCAARSGHDQVVDLLLERNADVASKTKNKLSPLHMAAQGDHADCARILLIHKAPIDDVTVDYLTPLHVAAHCGNVKTAKLLLDRKCEVDARALNGFTPLHIACKKNRIKVVELLLKYGASIEATTETGLTPLHVAAFMGHMNIVLFLIQNGANPDTPNMRGETALHHAARANQTDIIRVLLRNGATVDARARENQTPLHIAARLGNNDNVLLLLQHGATVDATTKDLYTPLHIAAKEGHDETAEVLLEHGADQNLITKKGFTPLHIAAKYGNIKVARLLLQKEANPNVEGKNGLTPLHVATHYNHVNVALLLLENGASPHATAKNGYTPLHIAAKKNQMDIATTLLEYGAKTNAESKYGFTPLHLASQEGHTDMVSLLLEHGADVNCKAKNGLTPMHLAAQEDKVPVAEILVKYNATIDPQTKAGYTPLHTACHFGQINMIRFLLDHNASVNATTKLGYTPLHQAAQQGHVLVINLLLKYKASPNAVTNTGQTPLSIAERLGYISVVEILKNITEVQATPIEQEDKYNLVSPETMQEALMTDSEDEGDDDHHTMGDSSFNYITTQDLHDDSISPIKTDERDFSYFERYSITDRQSASARSSQPPDDIQHYLHETSANEMSPVFEKMDSVFETGYARPPQEEFLQAAHAPAHFASRAQEEKNTSMYGSYSGVSFASSFDPDNVAVDRQPIYSGFLVSFMVDARGGAMRGCRHSGVRIIIPPGKASMPTRVTCKLVKKEKLMFPPPLMEGEALASRILEMGPVGAKFLGPVIIEVPHFASLRGKEREIVVLRSDNGETWKEHPVEATEDAIQDALGGSFEDLESAEDLYKKRITRILASDFPQYFAVVTRIRQESAQIGQEGGVISSTVVPQVQAIFTEGALTKKIKVGLQAQPVPSEIVSKMLGNRVAVSPIVTVEPRRRKFHKPITLTIPVPKAAQKGMLNQYGGDAPTLRLLCSITGGSNAAHWEDITGTTPLSFVDDCVSFTTTVSARYWLMDCQNTNEAARMATDLYREAIAVPFMSKFVVFAKRRDNLESRLRVFCMTDDKMDKTLESQEHFKEVARSRDVEVLEGKAQYVEMGGNIVPVTKSGDQLYINFHAFRENRLPFTVRVRDTNQDYSGRIAFMNEPKTARGEAPQQPLCTLNITLPDVMKGEGEVDSQNAEELRRKYELLKSGVPGEEQNINKAELQLTDIADALQGDWVMLAQQLGITEEEIYRIQTEYTYVCEQALVMLHLWVQKNGERATGNELERALKKIGREDVIRKCMTNVEMVTDDYEKAVAKVQLDQEDGFDELKRDIGPSAEPSRDPSRDSSVQRGTSLDVSYDEKDIIKESESAAEESASDRGSVVDREQTPVEQASPVREEPLASTEVTEEPSQPIEDLINAMDQKVLECVDDRMSESSEEPMVILDGDLKDGYVKDKDVLDRTPPRSPPPSPSELSKPSEEDSVRDREAFVQQTTTILESTPRDEDAAEVPRVAGDIEEFPDDHVISSPDRIGAGEAADVDDVCEAPMELARDDLTLAAPGVSFQAGSPVTQSPSEEDASIPEGFSHVVVDELEREEQQDEDFYEEGDDLPQHKAISHTQSTIAMHGSAPPSDFESEVDSDRPLSPSDFTLEAEPEVELEGRLRSDTSQQIFIEQSIEASQISSTDDRPPSPSHFTLVAESDTTEASETGKGDMPEDVFGVPEPVEPSSEQLGAVEEMRQEYPPLHELIDEIQQPVEPSEEHELIHTPEEHELILAPGEHELTHASREHEIIHAPGHVGVETPSSALHEPPSPTAPYWEGDEETDISKGYQGTYGEDALDRDSQFLQTPSEDQLFDVDSKKVDVVGDEEYERQDIDALGETEVLEMQERDRLKSSSYEDIYTGVKAPLEDVGEEIEIPSAPIDIGDRFDTKHVDAHFETVEGRTSSFENLYETSSKEAAAVEEKDVDEGDHMTDSDIDRPEKGAGEDEKYYVQSPPQMYASARTEPEFDLDFSDVARKSSTSSSVQYGSPIDVTLESGLDQVGQEVQLGSAVEERDSLERSRSYDVASDHDAFDRHRHYSSPDDVLHADTEEKLADREASDFKMEAETKSEGTDADDSSFPASPKEPFALSLGTHEETLSHSPPEPLSPSKEQALKEEVSPVYEGPLDITKVKIPVGVSPSDFIRETKEFEEEVDALDEGDGGADDHEGEGSCSSPLYGSHFPHDEAPEVLITSCEDNARSDSDEEFQEEETYEREIPVEFEEPDRESTEEQDERDGGDTEPCPEGHEQEMMDSTYETEAQQVIKHVTFEAADHVTQESADHVTQEGALDESVDSVEGSYVNLKEAINLDNIEASRREAEQVQDDEETMPHDVPQPKDQGVEEELMSFDNMAFEDESRTDDRVEDGDSSLVPGKTDRGDLSPDYENIDVVKAFEVQGQLRSIEPSYEEEEFHMEDQGGDEAKEDRKKLTGDDEEERMEPASDEEDERMEPSSDEEEGLVTPTYGEEEERMEAASDVEEDVVKPASDVEEDIVKPASDEEEDMVKPASDVEEDIVKPCSDEEEDMVKPASDEEEDIVKPAGDEVQDVVKPASDVEEDIVKPASDEEEDIAKPASDEEEDMVKSASDEEEDIVKPCSDEEEDMVKPESDGEEDIVKPASHEDEDVVKPASDEEEGIMKPASDEEEDIMKPASDEEEDMVKLASDGEEDMVKTASGDEEEIVKPASDEEEDMVKSASDEEGEKIKDAKEHIRERDDQMMSKDVEERAEETEAEHLIADDTDGSCAIEDQGEAHAEVVQEERTGEQASVGRIMSISSESSSVVQEQDMTIEELQEQIKSMTTQPPVFDVEQEEFQHQEGDEEEDEFVSHVQPFLEKPTSDVSEVLDAAKPDTPETGLYPSQAGRLDDDKSEHSEEGTVSPEPQEPHEAIQESHAAAVVDSILERHHDGFDIPDRTEFPIELGPEGSQDLDSEVREDLEKKDEESDAKSDDTTGERQDFVVVLKAPAVRHERSVDSIDRTESASLDSEDMEEPYGDSQKEEMQLEMQKDIAPSPLPPHIEGDTFEEFEPLSPEAETAEPCAVGHAQELQVDEKEKKVQSSMTSSSSDTSLEPTLLAATYDLDTGAVSRVVTTRDLSPDAIEKTLTVDTKPIAISSSTEDDVFDEEARLKDQEASLTEDTEVEPMGSLHLDDELDSRSSSPFEVITHDDVYEAASLGVEPSHPSDTHEVDGSEASPFEVQPDEAALIQEIDKPDNIPFDGEQIGAAGIQEVDLEEATKLELESERHEVDGERPTPDDAVLGRPTDVQGVARRPTVSLGEESFPSPVSSEPSDHRGPDSPYDAPAVVCSAIPDVVQPVSPSEPTHTSEELFESYVHANGPTEVDYRAEYDDPFRTDGHVVMEDFVEGEETYVETETVGDVAPLIDFAAVAQQPDEQSTTIDESIPIDTQSAPHILEDVDPELVVDERVDGELEDLAMPSREMQRPSDYTLYEITMPSEEAHLQPQERDQIVLDKIDDQKSADGEKSDEYRSPAEYQSDEYRSPLEYQSDEYKSPPEYQSDEFKSPIERQPESEYEQAAYSFEVRGTEQRKPSFEDYREQMKTPSPVEIRDFAFNQEEEDVETKSDNIQFEPEQPDLLQFEVQDLSDDDDDGESDVEEVDFGRDEEPEPELVALADESEESNESPRVCVASTEGAQATPDQPVVFEFDRDSEERPRSPEPVYEGESPQVLRTSSESHRESYDEEELEEKATEFVSAVLEDAKQTIKQNILGQDGGDADLLESGVVEEVHSKLSKTSGIEEYETHREEEPMSDSSISADATDEGEESRPKLESQASEDVPEIKVSEHLHEEGQEESYSQDEEEDSEKDEIIIHHADFQSSDHDSLVDVTSEGGFEQTGAAAELSHDLVRFDEEGAILNTPQDVMKESVESETGFGFSDPTKIESGGGTLASEISEAEFDQTPCYEEDSEEVAGEPMESEMLINLDEETDPFLAKGSDAHIDGEMEIQTTDDMVTARANDEPVGADEIHIDDDQGRGITESEADDVMEVQEEEAVGLPMIPAEESQTCQQMEEKAVDSELLEMEGVYEDEPAVGTPVEIRTTEDVESEEEVECEAKGDGVLETSESPFKGSPEHDEVEGRYLTIDARIKDAFSSDDTGDTSSVDSFATVIPVGEEDEDMRQEEDRLAEIASMTSSFQSDMTSSFHADVHGSLEDFHGSHIIKPLPSSAAVEAIEEKTVDVDEAYSVSETESISTDSLLIQDETGRNVLESKASSQVEPLARIQETEEEVEDEHVVEVPVYREAMELSVIQEESEEEKRKSSSSSDRLEVTSSGSSERIASSPDVPPSPGVLTHRFHSKSGDRDDVSVSSSLLEFEHLETIIDKTSPESFTIQSDVPRPLVAKGSSDDASISSSLAEFEIMEKVIQSESGASAIACMRAGTGTGVKSVESSSLSSLAEFERLEQEIGRKQSSEDDQYGSYDSSLDKKSMRSSNSSLAEFERLEREVIIDEELEAEAKKVVSLLESGALMQAGYERHFTGPLSENVSLSQEKLVEVDTISRDESSSSISDMAKDGKRAKSSTEEICSPDMAKIIKEASDNVERFGREAEEREISEEPLHPMVYEEVSSELQLKEQEPQSEMVPAEITSREIDEDSSKEDESVSAPGDSDSTRELDSVVHVDTESIDDDQTVPELNVDLNMDDMQRSVDADSLCSAGEEAMQKSIDSLAAGYEIPESLHKSVDSLGEAEPGMVEAEDSSVDTPHHSEEGVLDSVHEKSLDTPQGVPDPFKYAQPDEAMVRSTDSLESDQRVPQIDDMLKSTDSLEEDFAVAEDPLVKSSDSLDEQAMIKSTDSLEKHQANITFTAEFEPQIIMTKSSDSNELHIMTISRSSSPDVRTRPDSSELKILTESTDSIEPQVVPQMDKSTDSIEPQMIESTDSIEPQMMKSTDSIEPQMMKSTDSIEPQMMKSTDSIEPQMMKSTDSIEPQMKKSTDSIEPQMTQLYSEETHREIKMEDSIELQAAFLAETSEKIDSQQMTESTDSIEPEMMLKMSESTDSIEPDEVIDSTDLIKAQPMLETRDSLDRQFEGEESLATDSLDQAVPSVVRAPLHPEDSFEAEQSVPTSLSKDSIEGELLQEQVPVDAGQLLSPERRAIEMHMSLSVESGGWSQSSSVMSSETLKSSDMEESRQDREQEELMAMSCDSPDYMCSPPPPDEAPPKPRRTLSPESFEAKKQKLENIEQTQPNIYEIREQQRYIDDEGNIETDNRMHVPTNQRRRLSSDDNLNYENRTETTSRYARSASNYSTRSYSCTSYETPSTESTYLDDERRYTKAMTYEPGVGKISYSAESAMGRGWLSRETVTKVVLEPEMSLGGNNGSAAPPADREVTGGSLTPLSRSSTPTDSSAHSDNCYCGPSRDSTPLGSPMHRAFVMPERSAGYMETEPEGEGQLVPLGEGQLDIAEGGDLQTTRLVMKKQIHKKTVIRDGKEETIVTEDTHVEQDSDGPEELRDSMQQIIEQFVTNTENMGKED